MKFSEVVAQALAWLQREGRVAYRALQREFELDDAYLEDLKTELIEVTSGVFSYTSWKSWGSPPISNF